MVNGNADPHHHGFWDNGHGFKSVSWQSSTQDIDLDKIAEGWHEGDYALQEMTGLAMGMGWLIGRAHHQSTALNGRASHEVVLEDIMLGGGWDVLEAEMKSHSELDADWIESDFVLFNRILKQEGPLLGLSSSRVCHE